MLTSKSIGWSIHTWYNAFFFLLFRFYTISIYLIIVLQCRARHRILHMCSRPLMESILVSWMYVPSLYSYTGGLPPYCIDELAPCYNYIVYIIRAGFWCLYIGLHSAYYLRLPRLMYAYQAHPIVKLRIYKNTPRINLINLRMLMYICM